MADSFSQMAQGFHNRVTELQEVALLRVDGKLLSSCCTVAGKSRSSKMSDLVLQMPPRSCMPQIPLH